MKCVLMSDSIMNEFVQTNTDAATNQTDENISIIAMQFHYTNM